MSRNRHCGPIAAFIVGGMLSFSAMAWLIPESSQARFSDSETISNSFTATIPAPPSSPDVDDPADEPGPVAIP